MSNFWTSLLPKAQKNDEQSSPSSGSGRLSSVSLIVSTLSGYQDRYRELLRVSRQWRNLKEWKWFGFGHRKDIPGPAEMALFCPACPQPSINLPEGWKNDPQQWLFWRSFVVDGNFVALHQFQARSVDDVWIKSGESFMTERQRYKQHLDCTIERREVSTKSHFLHPYTEHPLSRVHAMNIGLYSTNPNVIKVVTSQGLAQWLASGMVAMHPERLWIFRRERNK